MQINETRICSIPFSGFYSSYHDAQLDDALSLICSDDCGEIDDARWNVAYDAIDWRKVHLAYAQEYTARMLSECGIKAKFKHLDSPREYNFRTDEIDIEISLSELQRIYAECDKSQLNILVADRLKARSGFCPFYSDDLADWSDLEEWESPQLSLLIECYCDANCDAETRDLYLMDDCNGDLTIILEQAMPQEALSFVYEGN
jgi:hypothetical protein